MTTVIVLSSFIMLTGLFLSGAAESLARPQLGERDIEEYANNAVYECLKALCIGGIVLVIGLAIIL